MVKEIRILIYILILFNAGHAFAYFQANRQSGNLRVEHTTYQTPTQDNNTYLIYDNLFFNDPDTFLVRHREDFIYFDKIELDIPLRLLKKNLIFEDDSVDRMLASNLRIKNLLNQYKVLNDKENALYGAASRGTDQPSGEKNERSIQKKTEEIAQERRKIETLLNAIGQYDNSSAISRMNNDVIAIDPFGDLGGQPGGKKVYEQYIARQAEKADNDVSQAPSGFENDYRQKQVLNRGTDKLPWIFTVALKIINYMMNNRIEIIVYTMFVIFAGFLVSLKAQK